MSSNRWPNVTREHPCPECAKSNRCTIAPGGDAGHCFRTGKTWHANSAGSNGTGTGHHRLPHAAKSNPQNQYDWTAEAERLRAEMTEDRLTALAEATGVPAAAWALLSPGWASADDLRAMRASGAGWQDDPPDGAYVFAEYGGDGRVVGLSLRVTDGRKGSAAGAKRGLVMPTDLHQRPEPVLLVEGASDVAALCALGLAAVGRPSNRAGSDDAAVMLDGQRLVVVGERDGKPGGAWPGRDGAKAVAQKIAGRWGEPIRWTLPPLNAKDVREWLRAKIASGLNATDSEAMRAAGAELLAVLEQAAKEAKPERRTQADALVDLALEQFRLGISTDGDAFAVRVDGPSVAMMFRGGGSGLRAALSKTYRATVGRTPSSSALADALTALEGMAADVEPEPVALRLAEHDGGIVLDLGDTKGTAAFAHPDNGTKLMAVSPVLFRRTALTGALPAPLLADAAALAELRSLLNVDDDSWPLVVGWLVAGLILNIPHPVLMLGGEQGTGKTTAARMLVGLVDPSPAPMRSEPRDAEQWAIAASGSWMVALDNVSHISGWMSDAICKAVTGDGLVRRKLYTDSDLAVLAFRRCIIITSIDPGAMRGDMGDRLVLADLERIADEYRRTEAELAAAYCAARPRLLGALLSAAGATLAALPAVKLTTMPRMADFARVLAALDQACPELTGGRALELFSGQRQRIADEVVESDPVAAAVMRLMDSRAEWSGTASELLKALTPAHSPKGWPTGGRALVGRLRRVRPALLAVGIRHDAPAKSDKTRTHRIEKVRTTPPGPPGSPEPAFTRNNGGFLGAEIEPSTSELPGASETPPDGNPSEYGEILGEEASVGGSGGMGGVEPAISVSMDDRDRGEL